MDPAAVAEDGAGYVVTTPGEVRETRPEVILTHSPIPMPERVETFADYVTWWEVRFEGFGMPDEERAAIRATLRERWTATADDASRWSYLALVEGVPVAEGSVRRTVHGPLWLAGGATLPPFRGRGIYRALVRARWDDAVRLGAGALVVIANVDTSYPILERLGFRAVGMVRLLADWAAPASQATGGVGDRVSASRRGLR